MGALGFLGGVANAVNQRQQNSEDPIDRAIKLYQLRQQISEDPLRRALLQNQLKMQNKDLLKMPDGSYQLVDLSNPSAPGVKIGASSDYAGELRALKQAAPAGLQPMIQAAIDSGDAAFQQEILKNVPGEIARSATQKPSDLEQYMSNPAGYTAMKAAGRNPSGTNSPFALWKKENPTGSYADWMRASTVGKNTSTVDDINNALGQMQALVGQLRTRPGVIGGIRSEIGGAAGAAGGYPDPAAFKQQASLLADMIPKALSGRANQSSINYALKYDVPSFWDTQASAQQKLDNLRKLFVRSGVLPATGVSGGPPDLSTMTKDVGTPVYGPDGRVIGFTK